MSEDSTQRAMLKRISLGGLVALTVVAGCSSPVGPDPTETVHRLEFIASVECPATGAGVMSRRTFTFEVVEHRSEPSVFRLRGPFNERPNMGDLVVRLTSTRGAVSGTVIGGGLSSDGVHTFSTWEDHNRRSPAPVRGISARAGIIEGTFSGYVTYSVFRTAGGGECTSAGHVWRLTQQG